MGFKRGEGNRRVRWTLDGLTCDPEMSGLVIVLFRKLPEVLIVSVRMGLPTRIDLLYQLVLNLLPVHFSHDVDRI